MRVFIRDSKGSTKGFEIEENDDVRDLIGKIKSSNKTDKDIVLLFDGIPLDENELISSYKISNGNLITYMGPCMGKIFN